MWQPVCDPSLVCSAGSFIFFSWKSNSKLDRQVNQCKQSIYVRVRLLLSCAQTINSCRIYSIQLIKTAINTIKISTINFPLWYWDFKSNWNLRAWREQRERKGGCVVSANQQQVVWIADTGRGAVTQPRASLVKKLDNTKQLQSDYSVSCGEKGANSKARLTDVHILDFQFKQNLHA